MLNACHEKNKEIQDLMFLMHSNPSEALVAEIVPKIKALNALLVSIFHEEPVDDQLSFHHRSQLCIKFQI